MQIRTQHYITVASQAPQEGEGLEPSQMDLGKLVTIHSTCDFFAWSAVFWSSFMPLGLGYIAK